MRTRHNSLHTFHVLALVLLFFLSACGPGRDTPLAEMEDLPLLPHSEKGCELYAWQTDQEWHFTLVTGTDRLKQVDEITAPGQEVTPDGWVRIQVDGLEALKRVLSRLPKGEAVLWVRPERWQRFQGEPGPFDAPPEDMRGEIEDACTELDLILQGMDP